VPEQRHVIDRVGTSDHARDQRRDLQAGVSTTGLPDPDMVDEQVLQAGASGELKDRREADA
jgi:hypothetical protein